MKAQKYLMAIVLFAVAAFVLVGCGKGGGGVDENKPVSEVKAEAARMDVEQLKKMAAKYKDAILAKQKDVEAITKKLAEIPLTKKLGTEAQGLTADIKDLTTTINSLKERFGVYYDKLKEMKADVSELTL